MWARYARAGKDCNRQNVSTWDTNRYQAETSSKILQMNIQIEKQLSMFLKDFHLFFYQFIFSEGASQTFCTICLSFNIESQIFLEIQFI